MKKLKIKDWELVTRDMHGENYTIQYGVDKPNSYRLSIKSSNTPNYYQLSIDKDLRENTDYQVWLYNINENMSYPMSIHLNDVRSKVGFVKFLDGIIELADKGDFSGNKGNLTTQH